MSLTVRKQITLFSLSLALAACGGGSSSGADTPSTSMGENMGQTSSSTPSPAPVPSAEPTSTPSPPPLVQEATTVLDCGDIQGTVENGKLSLDAKSYLLCKHNEVRSEVALGAYIGDEGILPIATNMRRFSWDTKLEQVAQDWANQCQFAHNDNRTNEYNALSPTDLNNQPTSQDIYVGENLAAAFDSRLNNMNLVMVGFNGLSDEGHDWVYGSFANTEICRGDQCGHFTQLIWANTYKVGCAVNTCPAGTIFDRSSSVYLVCDYAIGGNFVNQLPYRTGSIPEDACSEASSGQSICENGLTSSTQYTEGL